jgi:hypothetical protein
MLKARFLTLNARMLKAEVCCTLMQGIWQDCVCVRHEVMWLVEWLDTSVATGDKLQLLYLIATLPVVF